MIEAALKQLDELPAYEIHIADGCFDLKKPEHSTDGTLERLKDYAKSRENVVFHRVVRQSKRQNILDWIKYVFVPISLQKLAYAGLVSRLANINNYRLNQAATFNRMLVAANASEQSDWVMTYDADEYFDDNALRAFGNLQDFSTVVPIAERTFIGSLSQEAMKYPTTPLRYWNVPHPVVPFMRFGPPRQILWPARGGGRRRWRFKLSSAPRKGASPVGTVFHYKSFDVIRQAEAYALGDRKAPEPDRVSTTTVEAEHPRIAMRAFGSSEWSC